jgi:CDP-glycerol glycerophosphotransferase (TagB/SpsB family)
MEFLINYALGNPHINLIIRIHPIIKHKDKEEQKVWERLFDYKHIKVVHWEDPLSSYDLVKATDYSIVYHSTIGIEAAYMKKKAIILGTPWYVNLRCVYSPPNMEELIAALDNGEISHKYDFSDAIMYGYYILEHGIRFRYFKPTNRGQGLLCGKNLNSII